MRDLVVALLIAVPSAIGGYLIGRGRSAGRRRYAARLPSPVPAEHSEAAEQFVQGVVEGFPGRVVYYTNENAVHGVTYGDRSVEEANKRGELEPVDRDSSTYWSPHRAEQTANQQVPQGGQ